MASVSAVSSIDFRANLAQPQNAAPEGDDPFSLLLNSVADVKATAQRPEAPHVSDRRKDAPAKQAKPETDADRQARRHAKDTAKPDAAPQPDMAAPATAATEGEEPETPEADSDAPEPIDALLALTTGETPEPVPAQAQGETIVEVSTPAAPAAADIEVPVEIPTASAPVPVAAPALAAAVADATQADPEGVPPAQAAQAAAAARPKFELPQSAVQTEAEAEIALPRITPETMSVLLQPAKPAASPDTQTQVLAQPGPVNVNTAAPLPGPSQLEMLNAAISKHVQLSLAQDAHETAPELQKPLISSNAVTPNFAMTAQVNAPVQVQTQQVAEASRSVPLTDLAVEIATRAKAGERRFDIRLDPPELGRIDVKLEIDSKGNTTTRLIVERAETLDLLQRDARGLEKALQNAGLKTDAGSMQFSLSQDAQAQHGQQSHAPEARGRHDGVQAEGEAMTEVSINNASLAAQLRGGVDIRI